MPAASGRDFGPVLVWSGVAIQPQPQPTRAPHLLGHLLHGDIGGLGDRLGIGLQGSGQEGDRRWRRRPQSIMMGRAVFHSSGRSAGCRRRRSRRGPGMATRLVQPAAAGQPRGEALSRGAHLGKRGGAKDADGDGGASGGGSVGRSGGQATRAGLGLGGGGRKGLRRGRRQGRGVLAGCEFHGCSVGGVSGCPDTCRRGPPCWDRQGLAPRRHSGVPGRPGCSTGHRHWPEPRRWPRPAPLPARPRPGRRQRPRRWRRRHSASPSRCPAGWARVGRRGGVATRVGTSRGLGSRQGASEAGRCRGARLHAAVGARQGGMQASPPRANCLPTWVRAWAHALAMAWALAPPWAKACRQGEGRQEAYAVGRWTTRWQPEAARRAQPAGAAARREAQRGAAAAAAAVARQRCAGEQVAAGLASAKALATAVAWPPPWEMASAAAVAVAWALLPAACATASAAAWAGGGTGWGQGWWMGRGLGEADAGTTGTTLPLRGVGLQERRRRRRRGEAGLPRTSARPEPWVNASADASALALAWPPVVGVVVVPPA